MEGLLMCGDHERIEKALATLKVREADVIRSYYGTDGQGRQTLQQIAGRYDRTRQCMWEVKEKALRRLRHTARWRILNPEGDEP